MAGLVTLIKHSDEGVPGYDFFKKEISEDTEYLSAQRQTLVGSTCSQKEGEPKLCEAGPHSKAFNMALSALAE